MNGLIMSKNEQKYKRALESIISLGGNLSDKNLTSKTGPNDAVQRGILYTGARDIAKEALGESNPADEKIKAPDNCVIDDQGTVLEGNWTHKNDGHGNFHWRFDANVQVDDED